MTCIAAEPRLRLPPPGKWEIVRAAVFWGFILLVIASPAVLSAALLLRA